MSSKSLTQLVDSLSELEESRLATTVDTLKRHHEDLTGAEGAIDDRLFEDGKAILNDIDEIKPHLKDLQTGNLREKRSKREMREIRLDIERVIDDLYGYRTLVANEKGSIEESDAYRTKLKSVEDSIEPTIEYLRSYADEISDQLGS